MEVAYARFVRSDVTATEAGELIVVDSLASQIREHLASSATAIDAVHVHLAQSSEVQSIVAQLLTDRLAFDQEIVLTPAMGFGPGRACRG